MSLFREKLPSAATAILPDATVRELARTYRATGCPKAHEKLVMSHLRLVRSIAKQFHVPWMQGHADDLEAEGRVGLLRAIQKYDPGQDAALATYATYWIRALIMAYIPRLQGPVRYGTTKNERKVMYRLSAAEAAVGTDPELLATALGVTREMVIAVRARMRGRDRSLDAPERVNDDAADARLQARMLLDGEPGTPEDELLAAEEGAARKKALLGALATLTAKERKVVRARHLVDEHARATLQELGDAFGCSRENVRLIEKKALGRLVSRARALAA